MAARDGTKKLVHGTGFGDSISPVDVGCVRHTLIGEGRRVQRDDLALIDVRLVGARIDVDR